MKAINFNKERISISFRKIILHNVSRQSHQFSATSLGVQSETQNTEIKAKQRIINSLSVKKRQVSEVCSSGRPLSPVSVA